MIRTKLLRPETKLVENTVGRVDVILSDESEDRDRDIIRASGWELDDFLKHPVLLSSHDYRSLRSQIGEWENVRVQGKRLVATAHYYVGDGNEEADWAWQLAQKGRAAYSVGFSPKEWKEREGVTGRWGMPALEYTKQELLECSHVTVPANPNALQLMAKIAKDTDLDPVVAGIVEEMLAEEHAKAGRAMSRANLDQLHEAMDMNQKSMGMMDKLHKAVCDMGEDCPMGDMEEEAAAVDEHKSEPIVITSGSGGGGGGGGLDLVIEEPVEKTEEEPPDEPAVEDGEVPETIDLGALLRAGLSEVLSAS